MFAAALIWSCQCVELSIYSTCKRISQKLLRNVIKFLNLIHEQTGTPQMKRIRDNFEEIHVQGPGGPTDVRIVNSYPSRVSPLIIPSFLSHSRANIHCILSYSYLLLIILFIKINFQCQKYSTTQFFTDLDTSPVMDLKLSI